MPARITGELTYLITTQPMYAFASNFLPVLASSSNTLSLDTFYTNFFKHLNGFLAFSLEIGIYFYCNQLSLYSIQVFQMLLGSDLVLAQLHRFTSKYMPKHELSVFSSIKNNKYPLSILFFLIQQCWFEPSLSQGLIKWGALAIAMMVYQYASKKISGYACDIMLPQDTSQKTLLIKSTMQQLLWLWASIYLYPYLIQNLDSVFLAMADDGKYEAALNVLQLNRDATPQKIRKKCRELTLNYHPDLNRDSGARHLHSEIKSACETLREVKQLKYT